MQLLLLPLFFPLLALGWIYDPIARVQRRREREQWMAFAHTWLRVHGSLDDLIALEREVAKGAPRPAEGSTPAASRSQAIAR